MSAGAIPVLVEREDDGGILLRSPKLGLWSRRPSAGALLGAGASVGTLEQLDRRYDLVVPDGVAGRVAAAGPRDHAVPVEYGDLLLRLASIGAAPEAEAAAPVDDTASRHVVAPTDGVFYGAPAPGAPPFVTRGARVASGQTIGLIEVMKTFNPIVYGGSALPESVEVLEVLVADGEEVRAGQPLLAVR